MDTDKHEFYGRENGSRQWAIGENGKFRAERVIRELREFLRQALPPRMALSRKSLFHRRHHIREFRLAH